ncbi:MAG: hypothetical protein A2664_02915 [Candidatus Taylorbacteria bacterium RIFCSPHIGHO2_01_FULL_46_22b]|uniref:Uncharacterized protein n=1 Tax=Candidatus Taylorbacteria bacterium RIFCSPHIGHO2_01_FULL_46_22b TaxID=1802301 RepID=A0A1G2M472_9BACT|nr:MAG: hypothetical protein A2664_02915 [Candidatus Taylorbacteria bacterium RIFCSPHIGHO2_01_FULL_46_22b]
MKRKIISIVSIILVAVGVLLFATSNFFSTPQQIDDKILQETDLPNSSKNDLWWLSSGGSVYLDGDLIQTLQGEIATSSHWRLLYAKNNPTDTDTGYHPQNIFRLVTREKLQDSQQEVYFRIIKDNLSSSTNRNASNGVFLFNRYQDSQNLYYTGVRVDGAVVIKKKTNGTYYTMIETPFSDELAYDRLRNPNLLPKNVWMGLRSEIQTMANGVVSIKLYTDQENSGVWVLVAEVEDNGQVYGGEVISKAGSGGIRTDFMDVEFKDYTIDSL